MLHSAGSAILGHRRLRGAQLRRHPLLPRRRPLQRSPKPPLPLLPRSLRPPEQKGTGKGSFLAAAATSRSHFLPNMAAMAAPAAGKSRPPRAGQRRCQRQGREGDVTLCSAQPRPLSRDLLRRRGGARAARPGSTVALRRRREAVAGLAGQQPPAAWEPIGLPLVEGAGLWEGWGQTGRGLREGGASPQRWEEGAVGRVLEVLHLLGERVCGNTAGVNLGRGAAGGMEPLPSRLWGSGRAPLCASGSVLRSGLGCRPGGCEGGATRGRSG